MNAALRGMASGRAWFSEPGFDETDERIDRRVLVRAVGDEADPVVLRDARCQQHEYRFSVDGALAARQVLDRDLRGEPGGGLGEQRRRPGMEPARVAHHDLDRTHPLQRSPRAPDTGERTGTT
jgi:hypothetical protein